jgi:hypothetical protein
VVFYSNIQFDNSTGAGLVKISSKNGLLVNTFGSG